MPESITRFEDVPLGKPMLAWIGYPGFTDYYCFIHPQLTGEGTEFVGIEPSAFPDRGCLYTRIMGGDSSDSLRAKFGEIAVVTLNTDDVYNERYDGREVTDLYTSRVTLNNPYSDVMIEKVSAHSFSKELVQIVELEDPSIDLTVPVTEPVSLVLDQVEPVTQLVMVERVEGSALSYYGPFALQATSTAGQFKLDAVAQYRRHIFKLDSSETGDVMVVNRNYFGADVAAKFMDGSVLNVLSKRRSKSSMIDWITDDELVDALANVLRSAQDLKLNKEKLNAAKKAIAGCNMGNSGIYVTDRRKARMEAMLSEPELWKGKIDILSAALLRPQASEQLVDMVLSDTYFPRVKHLFVDSDELKEQVAAEERAIRAELDRKRAELDAITAKAQALRDEALADVEAELRQKQQELADVQARCEQERAQLEDARSDLAELEKAAEQVIGNIDDTASTLVETLANRRIVQRLSGGAPAASASWGESPAGFQPTPAPALREDEAEMTKREVLEEIREQLVENAGRNLSGNQVVNLMTCVMGSSITVLSGMPGTGKTSLAHALAGALGLRRPEAPRYTTIPVERGWTSHRDYIGYFNPLSGQLQASNTAVMQAMRTLDYEQGLGADGSFAPYFMLLDEANLSVLENYWSPFLSNADTFLTTPTELNMQGGPTLQIPSHLRWLATVNYDHTTEALSERFLNRAWVINVGMDDDLGMDVLLWGTGDMDVDQVAPFSYGKLMEVFAPQGMVGIAEASTRRLLREVFAACAKNGAPVSYRCQRAMARYVAVAEPLMNEIGSGGGARAVDFAVAQRVLPSINGVGDRTKRLLDAIGEVSPVLETTNSLVAHMTAVGEYDGFYQFFA
ncbi:MAG: hypothetical protein Q4D06_06465 [Coriobacteriia bacterium]|nr:hypothetical protein [Coriobacteriia bacterium]